MKAIAPSTLEWVARELRTMARSFRDLAAASRKRGDEREERHRTMRSKDCDAVAEMLEGMERDPAASTRTVNLTAMAIVRAVQALEDAIRDEKSLAREADKRGAVIANEYRECAADLDLVATYLANLDPVDAVKSEPPAPRSSSAPRYYFHHVSFEGIHATLSHDDRAVLEAHARAYELMYSMGCKLRGSDETIALEIVDRELVQ